MTVRDDRNEFAESGVQGLVKQLMKQGESGYVLLAPGGWRGSIVTEKPALGAGSFIHVAPGYAPRIFENVTDSETGTEYRVL